MASSNYVEKRNRTYYYIRHIPKKYQSLFQMKRVKYSLKTLNKKTAIISASYLNSYFVTLLYKLDNPLINNNNYRLRTLEKGKQTMMEMILKGVNYANKTIDHIELDPNKQNKEMKLFKTFQDEFITAPLPVISENKPSVNTENETKETIQYLIDTYSQEKVSTEQWSEKRKKEIGAIFTLFTRVFGKNIFADSVTRKMASKFKETLLTLPPNINGTANRKRYGGKSLDEIIGLNDKPMTTTNVNKYIGNLSSMFQWGEDNGYLNSNPFSRLKVKKSNKKKISEERAPFTSNDLICIHKEIYTRKTLKPYMYWLPLMGLYSGSRLREFSQLYLNDIKQIDDIWVFEINEASDDKSVKNANSIRLLPIHQKLIDLGLLEYVMKLKTENKTRLFPELNFRREGYATTPSVWFQKVREKLGMTGLKPKKDYHSYRHTFVNTLKQKGYPEDQVSAITGHGSGDIAFNRYGEDYNSQLLIKLMDDVNFDYEVKDVPKFSEININYK